MDTSVDIELRNHKIEIESDSSMLIKPQRVPEDSMANNNNVVSMDLGSEHDYSV